MDTHPIALSIIAPMYNEEDNVATTSGRIRAALDAEHISWELIIVNDGSTDQTASRAKELARADERIKVVGYDKNCGRGRALREGFKHASGQHIITIDSDLTYSEDQIISLYTALIQNPAIDAVLGSCYLRGGAVVGVDPFRLLISRLGNYILGIFFPGHFKTITCVFRGYKNKAIKDLVLTHDGKEIHLEILLKLVRNHSNIIEIPAILRARKKNLSKFKLWKTCKSHLRFILYEILLQKKT